MGAWIVLTSKHAQTRKGNDVLKSILDLGSGIWHKWQSTCLENVRLSSLTCLAPENAIVVGPSLVLTQKLCYDPSKYSPPLTLYPSKKHCNILKHLLISLVYSKQSIKGGKDLEQWMRSPGWSLEGGKQSSLPTNALVATLTSPELLSCPMKYSVFSGVWHRQSTRLNRNVK